MDLQLLQVPMRQWTFWLRPGQTMWLFLSNMMMTKRFSIFQNCVITTAYFGAGTWLNIGSKDWAAFAHGIMMLLRRLLAADVDREALYCWTDAKFVLTLDIQVHGTSCDFADLPTIAVFWLMGLMLCGLSLLLKVVGIAVSKKI